MKMEGGNQGRNKRGKHTTYYMYHSVHATSYIDDHKKITKNDFKKR